MKLKDLINSILVICFFLVPVIVWLKHFHPFVVMKEFIFVSCIIIAFSLLVIEFILEGKFKIRKSRILLAVVLYFVYNLLSLVMFKYTDKNYFFVFTSLILVFIVVFYSTDRWYRNIILHTLIIVSVLSSIYTYLQFVGKDIPQFINYFGTRLEGGTRAFSFFGNPNLLGGFCVFIIPIIAVFLIKNIKKKKWLQTSYFGAGLILALMSLYMSQTRGSWVAFAITSFIFIVLYFRSKLWEVVTKNKTIAIAVVIVLIVASVFGIYFVNSVLSKSGPSVLKRFTDTSTLKSRLNYYSTTLEMVFENPLIGRGFGTFNVYYPEYRDRRYSFQLGETNMEFRVEHAHNEHLELLNDLGIIGYLIFLWIIIEALLLLLRKKDLISFGIAMAIIGLLVDGLMMQNLRFVVISSLLWLMIGFSTITSARHLKQERNSITTAKGIFIIIVLVLALVPLSASYKLMKADSYVLKGISFYTSSHPQREEMAVENFLKVLELDKYNKRSLYYISLSYKQIGDTENAITYFDKLLAIDPNFIQANYNLGVIYIDLATKARNNQESDKAKEYLEKAKVHLSMHVKSNNMYWRSFYALAYVDSLLGEHEEAIHMLEEVRVINNISAVEGNTYSDILNMLAGLYERKGDFNKAIDALEELYDISKKGEVSDKIKELKEKVN